MSDQAEHQSATNIAAAVRSKEITAVAVTERTLSKIWKKNPNLNAFTDVTAERALAEAKAIDTVVAVGGDPGPLAGVPFAVKNLFDLEGVVTRAGSKINRENSAAVCDADLVQRLQKAGGVCLGALNMGEFAYDFTGENIHDGDCCNPHDPARMTGGSSSGSGAAVAANLVPITLGSDTNGSLRVPASLCGVYSLRPTYGRLSRGGTFPFVDALDTVGPFAGSLEDLAIAYDVLQGPTTRDHACQNLLQEPVAPALKGSDEGLRVGVLRGWFDENCGDEALANRDSVAASLRSKTIVTDIVLDQAAIGRAAAYLITHAESSAFHLDMLRTRANEYDPDTRDRFLAGALLPAVWAQNAQRVRRWWLNEILAAFENVDLLLAPATPFAAPLIGQKTLFINGQERPLRPFLGLLAQPFSCIGLPVLTVPVRHGDDMPIGVQLIASPWKEKQLFQAATFLE